jgi:hypothetical protein
MEIGGYIWDGHFHLDVNIESEQSKPIKQVSYTFVSESRAVDWMSQMENDLDYHFWAAEDFTGRGFIAEVPCSGRCWFGIDYGYVEPYRFIVVRIDSGDGKPLRFGSQIPSGRGPRTLTLTIP